MPMEGGAGRWGLHQGDPILPVLPAEISSQNGCGVQIKHPRECSGLDDWTLGRVPGFYVLEHIASHLWCLPLNREGVLAGLLDQQACGQRVFHSLIPQTFIDQ